ncbi:monocarboxylate transporter 12-B-like [Haliotis asinina]|uniref:monocarboxylate transporter 12-B-like n=1 Tax=Haliotis asinina TaxID=109174 RepID=UPI0035319FD6
MESTSTHNAHGFTNRQCRGHQVGLPEVEDNDAKLDGLEMQARGKTFDSTKSVIACGATQLEGGRKHKETEVMENACGDEEKDEDDEEEEDGDMTETKKLTAELNEQQDEIRQGEEDEEDNHLPIDRGWAWVVLCGCFLIVLLFAGYSKGMAIVFVEYIEVFDAPPSKTTLLFGVITGTYSISSVFTMHILVGAIGIRKTVVLGVMLNVIAMVTAIFARSITYLICTHSILLGASSAMVQPPCFVILGHYFKKRRGLATTMSVSGVSLGGIIFPRLIRFLVDEYALRGAMLILTGLSMNMWVGALLLRPLESFQRTKKTTPLTDETEKEQAVNKFSCLPLPKRVNIDFRLFTKPLFLLTMCFAPCAIIVIFIGEYLPSLTSEKGISKTDTATLLTIFNSVDFVSRLCLGAVVDRKYVKVYNLMAIGLLITGTVNHFTWFYKTFLHMLVFTVIAGLFGSFYLCLIPVVVVEFMGLEDMGKTLGFMSLFHGISGFITHPILGVLRDATGSFDASFNYIGSCVYVGATFLLLSPLVVQLDEKRKRLKNQLASEV